MTTLWQTFMATQTLNSNAQTLADNALYPLHQTLIQVQGNDAGKLLQGQLSCDIKKISIEQASLGSHNNPKGRMLSSFRINLNADDSYWLRVHSSIATSTQQNLQKYAAFSKSKVQILDAHACLGLHGEQARQQLEKIIVNIPHSDFSQATYQNSVVVCTSNALNSYEIYGPTEEVKALYQALAKDILTFDEKQHALIEHQLGLAFIQHAIVDTFIAQMLNYQATPAISFTKGCYTGQEIVARMHYLGSTKRRLYHLTANAASLASGDVLTLAQDGRGCGQIVSAVAIGEQGWDILAVLTDNGAQATQLYSDNGVVSDIQFINLPYALDA